MIPEESPDRFDDEEYMRRVDARFTSILDQETQRLLDWYKEHTEDAHGILQLATEMIEDDDQDPAVRMLACLARTMIARLSELYNKQYNEDYSDDL